jgi:hypothetical protein
MIVLMNYVPAFPFKILKFLSPSPLFRFPDQDRSDLNGVIIPSIMETGPDDLIAFEKTQRLFIEGPFHETNLAGHKHAAHLSQQCCDYVAETAGSTCGS